jgi:hypothetical protein
MHASALYKGVKWKSAMTQTENAIQVFMSWRPKKYDYHNKLFIGIQSGK